MPSSEASEIGVSFAAVEDAAEIFELQRTAYQTEAIIYDDFSIPPLVETLEQLQDQFRRKSFLKVTRDGRIVGSVRVFEKEGVCNVERLIVHPDYRRRGIGTALLRRVEAAYPNARRFALFTGHKSVDNLRLYERLGYRPIRREMVNEKVTLVFLEKVVGRPG